MSLFSVNKVCLEKESKFSKTSSLRQKNSASKSVPDLETADFKKFRNTVEKYSKFKVLGAYTSAIKLDPSATKNSFWVYKIQTDKGTKYFSIDEIVDKIETDGLILPVKMSNADVQSLKSNGKIYLAGKPSSLISQGLVKSMFTLDKQGKSVILVDNEIKKHIPKSKYDTVYKQAEKDLLK